MKSFLKIILLFFFLKGYNQDLDSIHYQSTSFFKRIYQQYNNFPSLISESKISNFTTSSISYYRDDKNIKLGQEPKKKQNFSIQTDGIYKNQNEIFFFGNISITKQYLDNLKWNLSYMNIENNGIMPNPNYYAVSKGSNWNNQLYDLKGGLNIPIRNKLRASIVIDYNLKEKFRYEYDPRPRIKQNILSGNIGLNYELGSDHNISIESGYGHSDVDNEIKYSDGDTNVPFHVDKYLRWNLGYGTLQNTSSGGTTKRGIRNKSVGFGYHFHHKYIKWLTTFMYQHQKTNTYSNNNKETTEKDINSIFTRKKYSLNSNLLKQITENKVLCIGISVDKQTGTNFLTIQNGKNYKRNFWISSLHGSISKWKQHTLSYQLGINLSFKSHKQQDKLAQSKLNHHFITSEIQFEKEFKLNKQWNLISNLELGYEKVLTTKIQNGNHSHIENLDRLDFAGQALKLFYNEVVYNDYEYLKQNCSTFHYSIHLKRKNKRINSIISISQTNYFINSKINQTTSLSLTLQY